MEKVKNIIKKYKIQSTIILTLVLAMIITIIVGNSLADPNSGYLKNQTVDKLTFENATLNYEEGVSTFTVEVYNESDTTYELKTISIKLSNEAEEETTLIGYIGESLESKEGRLITASIDKDLSDSTKLEYIINK